MGTISSAFSMMSQALDADQAALNIVANNVANANTPGYTRRRPTGRRTPDRDQRGLVWDRGYGDGRNLGAGPVLEERLDQQQQLASASVRG
jgi:flagellar hook-associated protein 1 FlgK